METTLPKNTFINGFKALQLTSKTTFVAAKLPKS